MATSIWSEHHEDFVALAKKIDALRLTAASDFIISVIAFDLDTEEACLYSIDNLEDSMENIQVPREVKDYLQKLDETDDIIAIPRVSETENFLFEVQKKRPDHLIITAAEYVAAFGDDCYVEDECLLRTLEEMA